MKKNRSENSTSPFFADLESRGYGINNSWKPTKAVCQQLVAAGFDQRYIQGDLRVQFILSCQNQDIRSGNWDKLFAQFAKQQQPVNSVAPPPAQEQPYRPQSNSYYQNSAATGHGHTATANSRTIPNKTSMARAASSRAIAMSDEWVPSNEMVKLIVATICPKSDYLKAQLISFTSHFHGQYNPNWDQQFKKWINNGWNVYGHRKTFNSNNKDERDFVEKHTDKSWREGL